MIIVMLGAPGAGKGTQAKMIAEKYLLPHISTGDIFRINIQEGTQLGLEAAKYMDDGLLVPSDLTVKILLERVAKDDCKKGYVLDGFPRTTHQAETLDNELIAIGNQVDYAINVSVPDESIITRMAGRRACLSCGDTYHLKYIPSEIEGICNTCGTKLVLREDDQPETVMKRLAIYHEKTMPLLDFYHKKEVLRSVNGTVDSKDVFREIVSILEG